jgi:hypothetical protein
MDSVQTTARPRPPAKVRRASANHHFHPSPPPPYAAGFTFPPSPSPTVLTSAEELYSKLGPLTLNGISEDWTNEISRENLHDILKKADGLIKFRANGLSKFHAFANKIAIEVLTLI